MHDFVYTGLPMRVVFGRGTLARLKDEVRALGHSRALVISTPPQAAQAEEVAAILGDLAVGTFTEAAMHTPTDVTARAVAHAQAFGADCTVAVGGGSTTGLGKAIALATDLDQIVVPTTYAGSEMTPILGQTENGVKTTQRSARILPEVVIYDVDLTLSLPTGLTATSGMNAIAHAVEALYAEDRNPVVSLMAEEGIAALARALPILMKQPNDREARSDALYGAWLCGLCLGSVGMALPPQALPYPWRQLRPAPRRDPYGRSAPRHRLQCLSNARGDGACRAGARKLGRTHGALRPRRTTGRPPRAPRAWYG
jgi:alcohol dehydrogenase class IV